MTETSAALYVKMELLGGAKVGDAQLDEFSFRLQRELTDVPGVSVATAASTVPDAKSATAFTLGAFAMAVMPAAVPAMLDVMKAWMARPGAPPVRIRLVRGDNVTEFEFAPADLSPEKAATLVAKLSALMDAGAVRS